MSVSGSLQLIMQKEELVFDSFVAFSIDFISYARLFDWLFNQELLINFYFFKYLISML